MKFSIPNRSIANLRAIGWVFIGLAGAISLYLSAFADAYQAYVDLAVLCLWSVGITAQVSAWYFSKSAEILEQETRDFYKRHMEHDQIMAQHMRSLEEYAAILEEHLPAETIDRIKIKTEFED